MRSNIWPDRSLFSLLTFALIHAGGREGLRDAGLAVELWAGLAGGLANVLVVGAHRAGLAQAGLVGEESALGTGDWKKDTSILRGNKSGPSNCDQQEIIPT